MKNLTEAHFATLRRHMVEVIDIEYELMGDETGLPRLNSRLREALLSVPRHRFVPDKLAPIAYRDHPLPIGFGKTISQPFMSALMVDLLEVRPGDRVPEIGTGLGYQTALQRRLAAKVWSVDVVEEFVEAAAQRLRALNLTDITLRVGDGSRGWDDQSPFGAILVTAAAKELPAALVGQLEIGGRLVIPLTGKEGQQALAVIERTGADALTVSELMHVQFTELETVI